MRTVLRVFFSTAITLASIQCPAQGIINFANNPSTLVSLDGPWAGLPIPFASYYALLLAPAGTTDPTRFTFSGLYGTNQNVAGRFTGGYGVQVPGWKPGMTMSFLVAGWTADLGHDWNPNWMKGVFDANGHWGMSSIGTGVAGGFDGTGPLPPLNLFGGAQGVPAGLMLNTVHAIPEPRSLVVTCLGMGIALIYRWELHRASESGFFPNLQAWR